MRSYTKKYWQDYEVAEVPDGKGGTEKILHYFGPVYKIDLPDGKRRTRQLTLLAAAVLCDAAFVLAATRSIDGNITGPASVVGLALVFPLFFLNAGCLNNLWKKQEMTRNDLRSSSQYIRYGSLSGALLGFAKTIWTIIAAATGAAAGSEAILAVSGYTAATVIFAVAYHIERKTKYIITPGRDGFVEPNRHHSE